MMEALFDDDTKPFYKFGDIMYLQRIPANYWIKYITDKFKQEEKQITRNQALWIVERVDGNSSYVQQLSWYVFQRTTRKVSDGILNEALRKLIEQCNDIFETKTDDLTAYQMNFLRAIADGHHTGLSSAEIIQKYHLGSSANVSIIKKSLTDKDLILTEDKEIFLSDPVMGLWLQLDL